MASNTKWVEITGMNIQADRDAHLGEKTGALVINPANDSIIENNIYIPINSNETGQYSWPPKLAEKINSSSNVIRGGEMDAHGNIVPISSHYRNNLWKQEGADLIVFPINCCLSCWNDGGEIKSSKNLAADTKITIIVRSRKYGVVYENLVFSLTPETSGMYDWPYHLSTYINRNSLFLRAGEKNNSTHLFTPINSSYRNHIWLPNGSNYTYEIHYGEVAGSDFQWDAGKAQDYNSTFSNTALSSPGGQLSKLCEAGFVMDAPGCSLTLEATDTSDIKWPQLQDGDEYRKLNMLFENGDFSLKSRGDIYLGINSNQGKNNVSADILLDISDSTTVFNSESSIIIGGNKNAMIKSHYTGNLVIKAMQIDFLSGNIHCEGNARITCAAI